MPDPGSLTERQQKWFAAVHDGLERETGRTLAEWADLARACPETAHRKRLAWMKAQFGLGQNRASLVLNTAFPPEASWSNPGALADALWADPAARAIRDLVQDAAMRLPDVLVGQRKGFTAFSRRFQFAAVKPGRGGVLLGLAIRPDGHDGLEPAGRDGWSERLLSRIVLREGEKVPALGGWLREAWEAS
jgi:hypothetical protein